MDPNNTPSQQPAAAPQPSQPAPAPEMPTAPAAPDIPKPSVAPAADKKSSTMWLTLGVVVVAIIVVAYFLFLK